MRARKTTLKALIEQGLRLVLAEKRDGPRFRLRDASVGGKGLNPEFKDASWQKVRDAIYKGEGACSRWTPTCWCPPTGAIGPSTPGPRP